MKDSFSILADLLDSCILQVESGGQTVEQCLRLYPEHRQELEPLLRLAVLLQAGRAVVAPQEFRHTAVTRMQNLIAHDAGQRQPPTAPRLRAQGWGLFSGLRLRLQPLFLVIGLALALLVAVSSVSYVSARALPGDPLYPIKAGLEGARLASTRDEATLAALHMTYAGRRLAEAQALLPRQGRSIDVHRALQDYQTQIERALAVLDRSQGLTADHRAEIAGTLMLRLSEQESRLSALLANAQDEMEGELLQALKTSQGGNERVRQAHPLLGGEGREMPAVAPAERATLTVTVTATPTPTATATATSTPSATPRPLRTPPTPVELPSRRPADLPPSFPTRLPTVLPTLLPTRLPRALPSAIPTSLSTGWPEDWPTPQWPENWPTPGRLEERPTLPPREERPPRPDPGQRPDLPTPPGDRPPARP